MTDSTKSSSSISIPFLLFILAFAFGGCNEPPAPKPVGYYRITPPPKEYKVLEEAPGCPYTFKHNTSAHWEKNKHDSCWGDLVYPRLRARIQLTYRRVEGNLDTLLRESQDLAYSHTVKADGIREQVYSNTENDVHGMLFRMQGDVATATQFFVTDSTNHFLRGVVYFYAPPNADSLRPVNEYMAGEVVHLMETTRWKN